MLKIEWTTEIPDAGSGQLLAVPVAGTAGLSVVTDRFGDAVREMGERARFEGKAGSTFAFTRTVDEHLQHVVLLGTSDDGMTDARGLRQLAYDATRRANDLGATQLVLDLRDAVDGDPATGNRLAQGLELGRYTYDRFLSEDKRRPPSLEGVTIVSGATGPAEGTVQGQTVAASVARARDLANGPAELVTPTHLADVAREIVDAHSDADVSVTVLDEDECRARGMGCYLAVAQGSDTPPKFIHLRYRPKGDSHGRVCLVGKGVTFDSGGYSLKPNDAMLDMKMDMAGAAAVIGAFEGAVRLGLPWEIHAIVAAAENMVSGRAYRLGDVLTASNGKTVEINNTDAEGRLTLADALIYAGKLEPDFILDFATLTGACLVALGPHIAGVMTDDDPLAREWLAAADRAGEAMWRLPLPADLKEQLKSKIADMKNTGERWGGALTAGLFLSEFTADQRWLHVDIAGPAMVSKPHGVSTEGGSGFPVATILELLSGSLDLD